MTNNLNIGNVDNIPKTSFHEVSLQKETHDMSAECLRKLEDKGKEAVIQIKGRHARMRFLNNATRLINNAHIEKNDEIDLEKHIELKKLREGIEELKYEEAFLEAEADNLEKEAEEMRTQMNARSPQETEKIKKEIGVKKQKVKAKRDEVAELRDIQDAMKLLTETKKLTKEQRTKLLENCRSCLDDLNNINQLQLQSSNRLNYERHEILLIARMIQKTMHDDIIHKARQASGRS